jgi:hypothetical protein
MKSALLNYEPPPTLPTPRPPMTVADTGVPPDQLMQLMLKSMYGGEATGLQLAEKMALPYSVLEGLVEQARVERLLEVRGASGTGTAGYRYMLTDLGRDRARQFFDINAYVGPTPVPLPQYIEFMRQMRAARGYVDKSRIQNGFSNLIVDMGMLEQLGPAINSGKAVFLYGPPGNGKTVLGEGMGRTLGGDMYVPHAMDVDGQIITVYDPINHELLESELPNDLEGTGVIRTATQDRRWVRIKRPVVMVGGELTLSMLDLSFNTISKFYEGPLQLKANGGVFIVDDFGRQRMRPEDLLNRWIVPLESRVDFLTLHTGKKFQIPFDVLVVFATNLDPASLADEAFLRRIPYKIAVNDPTPDQFERIFELNCRRRNLKYHQVMVAYLQRRHYHPHNRPLRSCQPRDILDQVAALSRFRGHEPVITRELLDAACELYFLDEPEPAAPLKKRAIERRPRS